MAQIIPRSNFLAESFEKGFGQMSANMAEGISSGLQALANMKLQQMQQRHQQNRFQPLLEKAGYSPEIAALISSYDQPQAISLMNMLGLPEGMYSHQQTQTNPNLQSIASLLGTLKQMLLEAEDKTKDEMDTIRRQLIQQGLTPQQAHNQAWETVREKYILLPTEND